MFHTLRSYMRWVIVTDPCLCVAVSFSSLQLDARWKVVVKMVRMCLMGPLSWGRVKWPSIMGTGLLFLLLLSACRGQDTEGEGISKLLSLASLCYSVSLFLHLFSFIIQRGIKSAQLGFNIRIVHITFSTGLSKEWASMSAVSQQEISESLFMYDIC